MTTCKNCGEPVEKKFCPNCGQKVSVQRIAFKTLIKDIPHAVWHIEKGFLFNLVRLFKRPGYAIKDYLEGRRKNFYHPLSYMLLVLATMLVAMSFMKVHYYDSVQDAWMSSGKAAFWKEYDATQQVWIHYYKFYIPFYLPWMSLIFFLWLRAMKQKYNYWECIVISFFVSAQMTVPQIFVLVLAWLVNNTAFTRTSDQILNNGAIFLIYFFQFYQLANPVLKKGWRILLSVVGALILVAFAYTAIYVFLKLAIWAGI